MNFGKVASIAMTVASVLTLLGLPAGVAVDVGTLSMTYKLVFLNQVVYASSSLLQMPSLQELGLLYAGAFMLNFAVVFALASIILQFVGGRKRA